MARHSRFARAFTLIELMTVVTIIGLLGSIAIPGYNRIMVRVREVERTTHLTTMRKSLVEQWRTSNFKLPSSTNCTTMIPNDATYKSVAFKTGITAGSTNAKCWETLNWGIDGGTKLRFKYVAGTQATPRPNTAYFDIYAYADLNSNGVASYIQLHCVPDEKQECAGGVSYTVYSGDPTELQTQTVSM
jgi:prepilin-type N-terminal cleavage/methylation domain-containing protein